MATKYSAKDKFTAKPNDFEVVYMPPKKQADTKKNDKKPAKKK